MVDGAPTSDLRIGLLDFGDLALGDITAVAQLADDLGYARYWIAEHLGLVTSALLVTPLIAVATARIRVGPAGVLLRYHAATAVARDGILLESIFGRVDLGLAGGRHPPGTDEPFLDGRTDAYVPERFEEKLRLVAETVSQQESPDERPELWVLGGSGSTHRGESAARLHAHFSLSLMHMPTPPSAAPVRAFREEEARLGLARGHAGVAIQLACVESAREREGYASPHRGVVGKPIVETAALCRERIEEICHAYDVSEVSILEGSAGFERRSASITMLAEAFGGLAGPPPKGRIPALAPSSTEAARVRG